MSTRTDKFVEALCNNSASTNYNEACSEWKLEHLHYDECGSGECICGQKNITNIVVIKNTTNNKVLDIGANCASTHLNIRINTSFYIKARLEVKIRLQRESLIPKETVISSHQNRMINDWEYNFYMDMHNANYRFTKNQKIYIKKIEDKLKNR